MRRRVGAHERGQTLVEFALILPIFVLVLVGIFDGGRLVFSYHTVNNAAREGGREATVNQTITDIQARAAQHAVALDIAPSDVQVDFRQPTTPNSPGSCNGALNSSAIYGCLAVVRAGRTPRAVLPEFAERIPRNKVVGIFLNDGRPPHHMRRYYRSAYYGDGAGRRRWAAW